MCSNCWWRLIGHMNAMKSKKSLNHSSDCFTRGGDGFSFCSLPVCRVTVCSSVSRILCFFNILYRKYFGWPLWRNTQYGCSSSSCFNPTVLQCQRVVSLVLVTVVAPYEKRMWTSTNYVEDYFQRLIVRLNVIWTGNDDLTCDED